MAKTKKQTRKEKNLTLLPKSQRSDRCQNCGCPEELDYYEHVLGGIILCDPCSWETPKNVKKLKNPPQWKYINKEWMPPECKDMEETPDER